MAIRTPITWKNIDSTALGRAAATQEQASRRLDKGFESAFGVLDTLSDSENKIKAANSQDFQSRVNQQYQTADALTQAQGSGELNALRERYAANGGLDAATSNSQLINGLIGERQTSEQGAAQHEMAQRVNESNLTTAAQTRQQNAGRYKNQQDAAAKTAFEAEEAEKLSMLVGNSNAAGIQQGLESGTLGRPDVWQTALKDMQSGAVNNAMNISLANDDIAGAQAAIPALPVGQQAAAITRLDPIRDAADAKIKEDGIVSAYSDSQQLDQGDAEKQLLKQQDLLRAGVDVGRAATDDEYFNSLDAEQLDMYQQFAQDTQNTYGQKYRQTDTDMFKEIQQDYIDSGKLPDEAATLATAAVKRIQSAGNVSSIETEEIAKRDAKLREAFKGNSIVRGFYDPVEEAGLQELVGPNYEKLQNLTGKAKDAADEVLGWVRQGEMPADDGKGINGKWPLTKELVQLAFNSTEGGQSAFWDTILPGTANVKERFRDFIKSGIYDEKELKGFQDFKQQRADGERAAQISADASVGVVQDFRGAQAVSEASIAAEQRLAQSIQAPGQTGGPVPNVPVLPQGAPTNTSAVLQGSGEAFVTAAQNSAKTIQQLSQSLNASSTTAEVQNFYTQLKGEGEALKQQKYEQQLTGQTEAASATSEQLVKVEQAEKHYNRDLKLRESIERVYTRYQTATEKLKTSTGDERNKLQADVNRLEKQYQREIADLQAHQSKVQGN